MTIFGSTHPTKIPPHFFFGSLAVHYDTAVRANVERQNYSVCPRHWYMDAEFMCERCGREFIWTAGEQKAWFEDYFFWVDSRPRQCGDCRAELRRLDDLRKEYDATVAAARSRGTPSQKSRIIEILSDLRQAFGMLPEKMTETLELFQRQAARPGPGDPAKAAAPSPTVASGQGEQSAP